MKHVKIYTDITLSLFKKNYPSSKYKNVIRFFFVKSKFNLIFNMAAVEKAKIRASLELFYGQNTSKNKKNEILKQHVYAGNWSAKSREGLIRRIKKCIEEIDMDMVVNMFDKLKPKIHKANENGLDSLL